MKLRFLLPFLCLTTSSFAADNIVIPIAGGRQATIGTTDTLGVHTIKFICSSGCVSGGGTGANNADSVAAVATGLGSNLSYTMFYNGTTWDRMRGDTTNGVWVQVKTVPANQTVDLTRVLGAAPSASNPIWIAPQTNSLGAAAANPSAPFAVQEMVSDGTLLQRVLAPIILGDGVNGNNMVSVGSWMWNGTTWDRVKGDATKGLQVNAGSGTFTNRSSSMTLGGTSQQLAAVNTARRRLIIQNPCSATSQGIGTAENLFINFTSSATTSGGDSVELQPCGSYDTAGAPASTEAITVNAATTGHKFVAKEM